MFLLLPLALILEMERVLRSLPCMSCHLPASSQPCHACCGHAVQGLAASASKEVQEKLQGM